MHPDDVRRAHEDVDRAEAEILEKDLALFVREAWRLIEPGTELRWNWHHDAICEHLEAVTKGKLQDLIINVPPGTTKSTIVSVMWPVWMWTRNPATRFLTASYDAGLAERDSVRSRLILESEWFSRRWGSRVQMRHDQNTKQRYVNTATGFRLAVGVGGGATGEHVNVIGMDDPIDAADAFSDTVLKGVADWFDQKISTRLIDPTKDARVLVMQRLNEKDLTGHLLQKGGWVHLRLPMRFEQRDRCVTILPFRDPRQEERELLWPAQYPEAAVAKLELELQAYGTAGQLQQRPVPAGGALFKREHFRYYVLSPDGETVTLRDPQRGDRTYSTAALVKMQAVDPAASMKTKADYFVDATAAFTDDEDMLVLDVVRGHYEGPDQMGVLEATWRKWGAMLVGVETVGYQLTFFQAAARTGLPIIEITRDAKDKYSRALALAARYQTGKVFHPVTAAWLQEFEHELLMFPAGAHDDQVDTTVDLWAMRVGARYSGDAKAMAREMGMELDNVETTTEEEALARMRHGAAGGAGRLPVREYASDGK